MFSAGSRWAQWIGWLLVGLYILGFGFWLGVGIYVAADTPSNLEHILFSAFSISVPLIALILLLLRLFASGDDWWENGTPSWLYPIGFWILSGVGMTFSLFVMLRSILDSQFTNSTDKNLLIALDATLLGISALSLIYQTVLTIVVLMVNRPVILRPVRRMVGRRGTMSRTTTTTTLSSGNKFGRYR